MGEGRRERSSKRRRSLFRGTQKSSSDSEIVPAKLRERKSKFRDDLPWPKAIDVLTVDELARYRRRRVRHPENSFGTGYDLHDDHFEHLVSEYRRAFRATSENSLVRKNDGETLERVKRHVGSMDTDGEISNRPLIIKSGANLKHGGEFYGNTEYSNYGTYEGVHRAELARRPTSLRMEGDMQTVTEQCEKFIEWFNVTRPELARVPTHLKLEGQQETSTENHDKYIPFVGVRRPEILRQIAHLRLEGETTFLPEYTDVFRQPLAQEKRFPMLPESHLRAGGEFSERTEHSQQFIDPRGSVIPENSYSKMHLNTENNEEHLEDKQNGDDDMKMLVSKLEDLKGPPLETPEYKDAYRYFPRERPKLMKPEDEIGRADGTKVLNISNPDRFHKKINKDPEYHSKYLDKERQTTRKPSILSRSVPSNFHKHLVPDLRSHGSSEVRSQYVPHGNVPRVETLRMPQNLRAEGHMDLHPEYRDAYCGSLRKGRENNWIINNNSEEFGAINAQHDQDAFQVLQTRIHENVSGKPPAVARRASRMSQVHRPMNFDAASPSTHLRHQSPSPTYRLHVHNIDNKPRDFSQRRSSMVRQTNASAEEGTSATNYRSYEPSFGKEQQNHDHHAFVVLDNADANANASAEEPQRRKRADKNSNTDDSGSTRIRKRSPPNWMPPWYDNTADI